MRQPESQCWVAWLYLFLSSGPQPDNSKTAWSERASPRLVLKQSMSNRHITCCCDSITLLGDLSVEFCRIYVCAVWSSSVCYLAAQQMLWWWRGPQADGSLFFLDRSASLEMPRIWAAGPRDHIDLPSLTNIQDLLYVNPDSRLGEIEWTTIGLIYQSQCICMTTNWHCGEFRWEKSNRQLLWVVKILSRCPWVLSSRTLFML